MYTNDNVALLVARHQRQRLAQLQVLCHGQSPERLLRSAQARAYDDRAYYCNIDIPDRESICPVVICPYLGSSDVCKYVANVCFFLELTSSNHTRPRS